MVAGILVRGEDLGTPIVIKEGSWAEGRICRRPGILLLVVAACCRAPPREVEEDENDAMEELIQ
jgi:hypothetical protein